MNGDGKFWGINRDEKCRLSRNRERVSESVSACNSAQFSFGFP